MPEFLEFEPNVSLGMAAFNLVGCQSVYRLSYIYMSAGKGKKFESLAEARKHNNKNILTLTLLLNVWPSFSSNLCCAS